MGIKLSACTITKNEEGNIKRSIESYKDFVDEIIIVDTGSVDDTIEIAESLGAKVLKFEWDNDFSAAKNYAIDEATGDWIIFLDADEWFDGDSAKNIRSAIEKTIKEKYFSIACKLVNFSSETEVLEVGTVTRIFKKDKNIRYERSIHELLFDEKEQVPLPGLFSYNFTINHSGYMLNVLAMKAERNKMLLDKVYASGKALPIDYFYCLRENININPELSNYFFKLIESIPDYEENISGYNIASAVDENKVKVANKFQNEYSFEKRLEVLNKAQKNQKDNPIFKYYEYVLFADIDKEKAIEALREAVVLSKDFETKYPDKINSFYSKEGDTFSALGEYEILKNDKVKALEYFTKSAKAEYCNQRAFWGLISIIGDEKDEEIILFLNSIYDKSVKEILKFLVDILRLTPLHEVFLYFFVEYNKRYNEIDCSFFTSRLITGNYAEMTDLYMKIFNESKESQAMTFISAALIAGELPEKYSQNSVNILPVYSKILNSYFNGYNLSDITEREYSIFREIFKEIAFIAEESKIEKLINIFGSCKEQVYLAVIRYYFDCYSYDNVCKWIQTANANNIGGSDFKAYTSYVLTNIYFRKGDSDKLEGALGDAVSGGYLNQDIIILCKMLEASDQGLEYYNELYNKFVEIKKLRNLDEIQDINSDEVENMTIEILKSELLHKPTGLVTEQAIEFFEFAERAFNTKAYKYAEKFYKIALKYGYNKDKCYYSLGYIYNFFDKPDLSFYCYERAFTENFLMAKKLLPSSHKNYGYVYSKKEEEYHLNCPICGKLSNPVGTYVNIQDEKLNYNVPVIAEYMKCDDCRHIFIKNENKEKNFWDNKENKKDSEKDIEKIYNVLEYSKKYINIEKIFNVCEKYDKIFKVAVPNLGYKLVDKASKSLNECDLLFTGDLLEKGKISEKEIKDILEKVKSNGVVVFNIFDFDNAFCKLSDKPLWTIPDVLNVFSRDSLGKLLNKFGLELINVEIDMLDKGKIFAYAIKK